MRRHLAHRQRSKVGRDLQGRARASRPSLVHAYLERHCRASVVAARARPRQDGRGRRWAEAREAIADGGPRLIDTQPPPRPGRFHACCLPALGAQPCEPRTARGCEGDLSPSTPLPVARAAHRWKHVQAQAASVVVAPESPGCRLRPPRHGPAPSRQHDRAIPVRAENILESILESLPLLGPTARRR